MIKRRGNNVEADVDPDMRSPRISWSVLTMGAGVIASIVLNYAAYDTRITVLERVKLADEKVIADLQTDVGDLRKALHDLEVRVTGQERDIEDNTDEIKGMVDDLDQAESEILDLKMNKKKTGN